MGRDELRITLQWLVDAVGGQVLAGDPGQVIGNVATDTRLLQAGEFFVALHGPRYDGNVFVGDAQTRGAAGALVDDGYTGQPWGGMVRVHDTTLALQALAGAVRKASGTRVVAITGSAGKTTTKEAIAELLGTRFRVVRNKGNLNNHIGLPLSLLQLRSRPDVAVMELGMNHAGEIRRLVEIADPEVRVWTNVGDAHLGFFDSPDRIAASKAEILEGADAMTLLVCNADDQRVMGHAAAFRGRTVTFGMSPAATVRACDVEDRGIRGTRARVTTRVGERVIETPLLGQGNLSNVLAATAVALEFGVPLGEIAANVARLTPADRRGVVRQTGNGVTVIDDSYNSSPTALQLALEVVARETGAGRKVAALGEMLELGDASVRLHDACGRAAAAAGIELLLTVGGAPAQAMAAAAVAAGMAPSSVIHRATSAEAAADIAAAVRPGDLVLVKGSRGIRMDVVVDRLLAGHA